MPLDKSGSKESVGKNIRTEKEAGKPHDQAVAIALDTQRRAKGYSHGGPVTPSAETPFTENLVETKANETLPPTQCLRRGGKAGWRRGI